MVAFDGYVTDQNGSIVGEVGLCEMVICQLGNCVLP